MSCIGMTSGDAVAPAGAAEAEAAAAAAVAVVVTAGLVGGTDVDVDQDAPPATSAIVSAMPAMARTLEVTPARTGCGSRAPAQTCRRPHGRRRSGRSRA